MNDLNSTETAPILVVLEDSLQQQSNGHITGVVYWKIGEDCFPESNWNDFVVVIVGWWADAAVRLIERTSLSEVMDFMDGPFSIHCSENSDSIDCEFVDRHQSKLVNYRSRTTGHELGLAILDAGKMVLRECHLKNFRSSEVTKLQTAINQLRGLLKGMQ